MSWGDPRAFPRAILHIDGDSFFASCEVAKDPRLRGKPVITGKERGIVSACTYEAKRLGVTRGMQLHQVLRLVPDAVILPSDYETYSLFSHRMYEIVRRYTPDVEEYSIDECFADLTGMRRVNKMGYAEMAAHIKADLERELGMTFSIGVSATKVLAKIGSKWAKPSGLTLIPFSSAQPFLEKTPIGSVWGIGPNTAAYLHKFGVRTAYAFTQKSEEWVRAHVSKPFFEIWHELRGTVMYELDTEGRQSYRSIAKTKTFTPPSREKDFVFSQLSKNIENACIKARRWGIATSEIFFFLKTQEFKYHGCEVRLPHPSSVPHDILATVRTHFGKVFRARTEYRATGIVLLKLHSAARVQLDLFGRVEKTEAIRMVFESVDSLSRRYGKHAVFLGSSFLANRFGAHLGERGDTPARSRALFPGESARRRIGMPSLGEVS